MDVIELFCANAPPFIRVTFAGTLIVLSLEQRSNAQLSMNSRESGRVTVSRLRQVLKLYQLSVVTPSGITRSVITLFPVNAFIPMALTFLPSSSAGISSFGVTILPPVMVTVPSSFSE